MGKKVNKKPVRDEEEVEQEHADAELEAELAAVKAIQEEKRRQALLEAAAELEAEEDDEEVEKPKRINPHYNKEGLAKCLENLETAALPFVQNYQICDYKFAIENELDDIEREVSAITEDCYI